MIDTKYYKLLKKYPNHSIGDLAMFDEEADDENYLWSNTLMPIPSDFQPDINPDWFELCLFVTEDGVPKFVYDKYVCIKSDNIFENISAVANRDTYLNEVNVKRFSTKEMAESYLNPVIKFDLALDLSSGNIFDMIETEYDSNYFNYNVLIGHSSNYGKVYKCWNVIESDFVLYFDTKS